MAIRIDSFQPVDIFKKRMKQLMDDIRNEPRRDADVAVMVPGDPEKKACVDRSKNGIPIKEHDLQAFKLVADRYKVKFIK